MYPYPRRRLLAYEKIMFNKERKQNKRITLALEWQQYREDAIPKKIAQLNKFYSKLSTWSEKLGPIFDYLEVIQRPPKPVPPKKETQKGGNWPSSPGVFNEADSNLEVVLRRRKKNRKYAKETLFLLQKADDGRQSRKAQPKIGPPTKLMNSEWMVENPIDFYSNWLGMYCPLGQRVLVFANGMSTRVFGRRGNYLGEFQSYLPGGNRNAYKDRTSKGMTMMDCIFSKTPEPVFYVVDVICWNDESLVQYDAAYRFYFLGNKFCENAFLGIISPPNEIVFKLLPKFETGELKAEVNWPEFPEPIDGILFYHKRGLYLHNCTAICLWTVLGEVRKQLDICLPEPLLQRQATRAG